MYPVIGFIGDLRTLEEAWGGFWTVRDEMDGSEWKQTLQMKSRKKEIRTKLKRDEENWTKSEARRIQGKATDKRIRKI
jgi:hypothetical protein